MGTRLVRSFNHIATVDQPQPLTDIRAPLFMPRRVDLQPMIEELSGFNLIDPYTAVLGRDADQRPLLIKLGGYYVSNIVIAGDSGAGKSALLRTIVMSLAMTQRLTHVQFALLDVASSGSFSELARLPHLFRSVAVGVDSGQQLVAAVTTFAQSRLATGAAEPRLVVVVDDAATLLSQGEPQTVTQLNWLVQHGGRAGLHVIAATRSAECFVKPPFDEDSFPIKILGKLLPTAGTALAGLVLPVGRLDGAGDFLVVVPGCPVKIDRFRAAYIASGDTDRAVKTLLQQEKQRRKS